MKFIQSSFIAIALIFTSGVSYADQAAAKLHEKIGSIKTLSAAFSQEIIDHEGIAAPKTSGQLLLARPNKIRWQAFPPQEQLIVGNGETLWVYDEDLEQVSVYSSNKQMSGPLTLLSYNLDEIKKTFSVTQVNTDAVSNFILSPLVDDADDAFTELHFSFTQNVLSRIVMKDKLKQETRISLTDVKLNASIEDSEFNFTVPEGVDVVVND